MEEKERERRIATDEEKRNPICGPDVTQEVSNTLDMMKNRFNGLDRLTQVTMCQSLVNIPEALKSWDIIELHRWGQTDDLAKKGNYKLPNGLHCATPNTPCAGSVEVNNQCYYAGSVNYVVFGAMNRLCQENSIRAFGVIPFTDLLRSGYIAGYKSRFSPLTGFQDAPNYQPSQDWAKAGYDGWPNATQPPGDRPGCATICGQSYGGDGLLSVKWKVRLNIRNRLLDIREQINRLKNK